MNRQIFAWDRSQYQLGRSRDWLEWLWLLGLLLAALVLFGLNLGSLPLTVGETTVVARTAQEALRAGNGEFQWLLPTSGDQLIAGYSPVVHGWVAGLYRWGEVNAWTTRSPGALLGAISVPLLYALGREVFPSRAPAGFAALIYLMFWPVVRQGRLATLDGPVLCFVLLVLWCALRCRRDLRWGWGMGLGLGLLSLTQGASCGVAGAIALLFLAWDTPRLLSSVYVWAGVLLGGAPAIAWFVARSIFWDESVAPILQPPPSAIACWDAAIASLLWLPFCLWGLRAARASCTWGWAKFLLVWSGIYLLLVPVLSLRFSVSLMPLYAALALAGGVAIAEVRSWPSSRPYPRTWTLAAIAMAAAVASLCLYLGWSGVSDWGLIILFASIALTLAVVAALLERCDRQFVVMLFWGIYVSLLMLASSPYWILLGTEWILDFG